MLEQQVGPDVKIIPSRNKHDQKDRLRRKVNKNIKGRHKGDAGGGFHSAAIIGRRSTPTLCHSRHSDQDTGERAIMSSWRTPLSHGQGSSPVVVTEEPLPRRHRREHDMVELSAVRDEVDEAVETDKRRGRVRLKRIVVFVIVAVVVATIVDVACHDNVRMWLGASFDWIEDNPNAGEFGQSG